MFLSVETKMDKDKLVEKYGLEKPFKIKDNKKKYAVLVKNKETGNINKIKFGAVGYQDFTQHKDPERRRRFKKRHKCAEKKNKLTPGYWSCKWSW